MTAHPRLLHTVIDTTDVRRLAEFYRALLRLHYRPGDEISGDDAEDDPDWLVLTAADGTRELAFQLVDRLERTTWPSPDIPMQMHLDMTVAYRAALETQRARAEDLGAQMISDESADPDEPLYVFSDPSGHPFCIFVSQ